MPKETFFNLPVDKRERIIDIALDEFGNFDYQSASISRIVAAAGIAKGSFYQYFVDKEDLYRYLFDLAGQKKGEFLAKNPPEPHMDIFSYLHWLAERGVEFELAEPKLSQLGYRALNSGGMPPEFLSSARSMTAEFFKQLIASGKEQGHIDPAVDADLAAFFFNTIFSELGQYMFRRLAADDHGRTGGNEAFFRSDEARAIVAQTINILKSGMGAHS